LIVVAIIGIIAAIAIPNLFRALNRGRQKRSMADMRTLATAVQEYELDFGFFPKVSDVFTLAGHLEPTFLKTIPKLDGWNVPFLYQTDAAGVDYTIASLGMDHQQGSWTAGLRTTNFNDDIVLSDGQFMQWPEGLQQ